MYLGPIYLTIDRGDNTQLAFAVSHGHDRDNDLALADDDAFPVAAL
jgi:hypothetical protein